MHSRLMNTIQGNEEKPHCPVLCFALYYGVPLAKARRKGIFFIELSRPKLPKGNCARSSHIQRIYIMSHWDADGIVAARYR